MNQPTTSTAPAPDDLDLQVALQLLRQGGFSDASLDAPSNSAKLQKIIDGLCELSLRDTLTGLANLRHFMATLHQEIDRVSRSGEIALLLLIDVDRFKLINDNHGHLTGDLALCVIAEALAKSVRPMDTVARYAGDEFAVILPNCRPIAGRAIAQRVCEQVEQSRIPLPGGIELGLTVSIGGAHISNRRSLSARELLERADQQLYRAKSLGRNQVATDTPETIPVTAEEKRQLLDQFGKRADE